MDDFGAVLKLPYYRGRIHPDYNTSFVLEAIQDCPALLAHPSCTVLEASRNKVGLFPLASGAAGTVDLVIKEFRNQGWPVLKSAFQKSKACRAWKGSVALESAGLGTARPVAYLEKRGSVFLKQSFFISMYVTEAREIRYLFRDLSPEALDPLVRGLADFVRECHKSGILHKDLSDGNVLVREDSDGSRAFFLLDTNRIRIRRKIGPLRGIKSVVRLGLPRETRRSFLAGYLGVTQAGGWRWWWYLLAKAGYTGIIAFKKALKLKTIARKLKVQ